MNGERRERQRQRENGLLLSHNKNKILPFAMTWMNLEGIMLSEISQIKKNTM